MRPGVAGQPDPEKHLEQVSVEPLVAPPPPRVRRGYRFRVLLPPLDFISQSRLRSARRKRRCWHCFACAFLAIFVLYLLLSQPRFKSRLVS